MDVHFISRYHDILNLSEPVEAGYLDDITNRQSLDRDISRCECPND